MSAFTFHPTGGASCLIAALTAGRPEKRITHEAGAWGADLVVGTRDRGGLARLIAGSVSEAVAMKAHCSVVVVVRAPARAPGKARASG